MKYVVRALDVPRGKRLGKAQALQRLLELAAKLEERLDTLVSRHSVRWWLSIARKVPLEVFVSSPMYSTLVQIRWTFDRAIVKYGNTSSEDIAPGEGGSWGPALYSSEDLERFFYAFYLAEELYYVASCYRRISKGAGLRFSEDTYECKAPPEVEKLMRLFDERKQRYGDLLDVFGSPYEVGNATSARPASDETLVPLAGFVAVSDNSDTTIGAFRPVYLSLNRVREAVQLWDDLGIRIRGFEPSTLLIMFSALCLSRWAPGREVEYQSRISHLMLRDLTVNAYSTVSQGAVASDLKYYLRHIGRLLTPDLQGKALGDIDALVGRFLAEFSARRPVDVHYGINSPLVIEQESVDVVDWLAAMLFIRSWIGELTRSERSKVGTLRGILFESKVRAYLERRADNGPVFWPPRGTPRSEAERARRRDVDLAVIVGDVMVLIECKVKLGPEGARPGISALERGEQWQWSLWKASLKWLRQVDETAIALGTGRATTDGHTLPAAIRFVIPTVCSPVVTYVGEDDPKYFLAPGLPRVCTPRELVEFLKQGPSIALNSPAVHRVAGA
jgi:hypothetical protein